MQFAAAMSAMLHSDMGRAIMRLTEAELLGAVVNDAYKPKMHKVNPVAADIQCAPCPLE